MSVLTACQELDRLQVSSLHGTFRNYPARTNKDPVAPGTKGGPKMGFYSASSHSRCQGRPNHNHFNSYRPSLVFRVKKHANLNHLDNIYVGWKESGDGDVIGRCGRHIPLFGCASSSKSGVRS
jgi:hypothetical protein